MLAGLLRATFISGGVPKVCQPRPARLGNTSPLISQTPFQSP
jgi:hypothetical protein